MNIIVKMHDMARVVETTRMDLHSGIMLEDDFLDISDYLNQGVLLAVSYTHLTLPTILRV